MPAARAASNISSSAAVQAEPTPLAAMRAAQFQGSKVLIGDDTTATSQTWAKPDGSLTTQVMAGPVRFKQNGSWTDIDTTLTANQDGSLSPIAFSEPVVLSGGGGTESLTQDLLTVGSGKSAITWQWQGALPAPTVSGNRAMYSDVQPGVDLVLEVRPTGVEQYLVLKSRPPSAVSFTLPLQLGADVIAKTDASGEISYQDSDGSTLASTPPAGMWSAASESSADTPDASPSTLSVTLQGSGASQHLQITPSQSVLQDPSTSYPMVLDPGVNLSSTYDTWVNAGSTGFSGGTATTDSIGPLSGNATRTFMNWNVSSILGQTVTGANLYVYNTAPDSVANSWQIWRTGTASSATTWANQPTWTANDETTSAGNGSSAGWVSPSILTTAQAWAAGSSSTVGMGLRTNPETGSVNQMLFDSINASSNTPYIQITYGTTPNTPENLTVQGQYVSGSTNFVNATTPTFIAYVTDPSFATLEAAYTLTDTTTSTVVLNKVLGGSTINGNSQYAVPGGSALTSGHSYQLQVWGYDGTTYSLNTQTTTFTVDSTAPSTPTISSTTYTASAWTNAASGSFAFSDSASDVQTWYYSFNGGAVIASNTGTCSTSCTLTSSLTPPAGWNTLKVWAADAAGNLSASTTFTFGADQSGVTSPTANQTVSANPNVPLAGTVPLDGTGPYAATNVRFKYQLDGTSGSWTDIPVGNVTNNGTTLTSWPVATNQITGGLIAKAPQLTGGGPALSWNASATLASLADSQEWQPIYVEAVFTSSGSTWSSPAQLMTYETGNLDNGGATASIGPCSVSLWTGACEIDATDASVTTAYGEQIGIDRTFVSNTIPASGPFGPGWTSSLPTDTSDVTTLADTSNQTALTGQVTVEGPDTAISFVPTGTGFALSANETGDETLTESGTGSSTTFTYSEPGDNTSGDSDTEQIKFTAFAQPGSSPSISNPWTYQAATVEPTGPAGASEAVGETFNATTGYPTQMLAPQPSGVTCNTGWAVGCEALNFTYNSNNEISKVTLETANSGGGAVTTDIACYIYGATNHRLNEVWDPRSVSSTCNFSSPVLPRQYSYNGSGQILTVTPPGLAAWNINYNGSGEVSKIYRTHSATYGGATQQTQILYDAPIGSTSSTNHPDLSAATDLTWGQYDDPVTATAVFGPGTTYSTSDLRPATVYALDANGLEVNVATFSGTTQAGWDVSTSQFDQYDNDVMSLTPQDRVYVEADNCSKAGLPSGCDQTILANALATIHKYSADGLDLMKVFSPTSTALVTSGLQTVGRPLTAYTYGTVNYPAVTPSDYSVGGPLDDVVSEVDGTSEGAASVINAQTDQRTTTYAYGLTNTDSSGWDYGTAVSADRSMGSTDIVRQTVIDDSTGLSTQVRQPSAAGSGSSQATTVMTYYTAGTTNISNCVNTAWVGLPCTTGPGAQPTGEPGLPGIPVTQVTSYDYLLRPVTTVSTVTDASGTQQTKTTSTTFKNGGLAVAELSISTSGGVGTSLPTQTFYYDSSTGLPTVASTSAATNCSSTGPLCTAYDDFGNQISFTDATGATTLTTPSITDGPSSITLKTPGGSTIQTASYTYAAGNEYRELPTAVSYAGGTGYSSVGTYTASYNADGFLTQEHLPDGSTLVQNEDTDGNQVQRAYSNGSTALYAEVDETYNSHGQVAQETRPDIDGLVNYSYDNDGRLQQTQDVYATGQCTSRTYNLDVDSNRTRMKTYPAVAGGGCSTSTSPTIQALNYDSSDRLTGGASASGIAYDAFGRITTVPSTLASGSGSEAVGYFTNDKINTLTQGSITQTWTLDPAQRYLNMTQSGSTLATTNHYSNSASDSPTWSALTSSGGASSTSVNDPDLTGELAATTNDTSSGTSIAYQLSDPQDNVIGTVDPSSPTEVVTPVVTDEFGNPTDVNGASVLGAVYGWLGGDERDAGNLGGVVLLGARGYLPLLGRCLSVDPEFGGSSNPYEYANQDPVNQADPAGTHARSYENTLYNFFYSVYDAVIAAAIVGNLEVESYDFIHVDYFDTRLDSDGAHGLAQWRGTRWTNEGNFATQNHYGRFSMNCQTSFILHELVFSYASVIRTMETEGLKAATNTFRNQYEVCTSDTSCSVTERIDDAKRIFKDNT